MKRRLFLKMFGGVAAAPAVVKPTIPIAPLSAMPLTGALGAAGMVEPEKHANTRGDKLTRLSQLRKLILGKVVPEEEAWSVSRRRTTFAEMRLNGLRSVSPIMKMTMLQRDMIRIQSETQRLGWLQYYKRLKNGTDDDLHPGW